MLVKAGQAVDDFINQALPFLEPGDIIIDGGNSHFPDSERRCKELEAKGFLFVGTGVSGGEEGARYGPSIMPGGSAAAWYILALSLYIYMACLSVTNPQSHQASHQGNLSSHLCKDHQWRALLRLGW